MRPLRSRRSRKPTTRHYYIVGGFLLSAALLSGLGYLSRPEPPKSHLVEFDIDLNDGQTRRIIPDASLIKVTRIRPAAGGEDDTSILDRLSLGEKEALALDELAHSEELIDENTAQDDLPDGGDTLTADEFAGMVPGQERRVVTVNRGDTLMNLLLKQDIERQQAYYALEALKENYDPRRLRPGDAITVIIDHEGENSVFTGLEISPSAERTIQVSYHKDSKEYSSKSVDQKLTLENIATKGTIRSSLYEAGAEAGVPVPVMVNMIRLFSSEYDFKRDLKPGDSFEILFNRHILPDGTVVRDGDIKYAALTVNGQHHAIYRYTNSEGQISYYDSDGEALGPSIMRRPVEKARISSRFGWRKHPTLGSRKMHWGTDFAAPTGTPIMAAGDGVINYIGRKGASGNHIRLKHSSNLETSYSHMSRFARGLKNGTKVRRGQVIGYIGSTGRSTGPHLHYEIIYNNKKVNALTAKLPAGIPLGKKELKEFGQVVTAMNDEFASIRHKAEIAARNMKEIETAKR